MPQVDAVGALADPHKGLEARETRQPTARVHEHGDEHGREHGVDDDAAVVHEAREAVDEGHHADDADERDDADHVEEVYDARRHVARALLRERLTGPEEREPRADEQRAGARVGAVVDARGVFERVIEHPHERGGDDRQHDAATADDGLARAEAAHDEQQYGPDEVELLLDGERPEVRERGGVAERVEVREAAEDVPPVLEPEERGHDIGTQLGEQRVVEEHAERGDHHHDKHDGGKEAAHAAQPELREVDGAGLLELGHE